MNKQNKIHISFSATKLNQDTLICPCDVDLTNKRANCTTLEIFSKAGEDLQTELAAIGYCEIGNVVITKGYNLGVKNIIFMPHKNSENKKDKADFVALHKGVNSALDLAKLYGAKKIAVAVPHFDFKSPNYLKGIMDAFGYENEDTKSDEDKFVDIVKAVARRREFIEEFVLIK